MLIFLNLRTKFQSTPPPWGPEGRDSIKKWALGVLRASKNHSRDSLGHVGTLPDKIAKSHFFMKNSIFRAPDWGRDPVWPSWFGGLRNGLRAVGGLEKTSPGTRGIGNRSRNPPGILLLVYRAGLVPNMKSVRPVNTVWKIWPKPPLPICTVLPICTAIYIGFTM